MSHRILRFTDCERDIRLYCEQHHLDFSKAKDMAKCFGNDLLLLQYHDPNKGSSGLYDESRMPVVLQAERTRSGITITATEHTNKYLGF